MRKKLMLALVAALLVGWAGRSDAGPRPNPNPPGTCTPAAPCLTQADCGVHPVTGQYLGICGSGPYVCLCY